MTRPAAPRGDGEVPRGCVLSQHDLHEGISDGTWLEVKGLALPEFMIEIELEAHRSR